MNRTSDYQFTIIVPFYNEADNVAAMERNLSAFLPVCSMKPACVLFVNDGSTDDGGSLVKEMCKRHVQNMIQNSAVKNISLTRIFTKNAFTILRALLIRK